MDIYTVRQAVRFAGEVDLIVLQRGQKKERERESVG